MDKRTYIHVYMDEWMEGRKEERVDGWGMDIWMGRWGLDRRMNQQTNRWKS